MAVQLTKAALDEFSKNGISQADLQKTVNHYREQGWSDDDISNGLWKRVRETNPHLLTPAEIEDRNFTRYPRLISQLADYGLAPGDYGEDATYTERYNRDSERLRMATKESVNASKNKTSNLGKWAAFVAGAGSASTLGLSNLLLKGGDAVADLGLVETVKEAKAEHPGAYTAGQITGYLNPLGATSMLVKGVSLAKGGEALYGVAPVAKMAGEKAMEASGSKLLGFGAKVLTDSALLQGLFTTEKVAENIMDTNSFFREGQALEELGGVGINLLFNTVFGGMGAAWRAARGTKAVSGTDAIGGKGITKAVNKFFSRTQKTVEALGGEENVIKAQAARDAKLAAGGTLEDATSSFFATIMEGLPPEKQRAFRVMMTENPDFRRFVQEQMAGANGVVIDSVNALTKPEYAKASSDLLKALWGDTKNTLGSNEVDFTKKGLERLLGLDNAQEVLEMRKAALGRAERKVMASPSLARDVRATFNELKNDLVTTGSRDLDRAANMVEQGTLRSFEGSVEQAEAVENAQQLIEQLSEQFAKNGREFTNAQAEDILRNELRNGARKHFKQIMADGTDSIMDINDIKEFFRAVDEGAVKAGQAEAFGAFNEGVNSRILDQLDPVLYKANQAQRFGKRMTDMHDFGKKYSPDRFNELESALNNGVSAEEKAAKLAAFKMGMLDRVTEAAVMGDMKGFEQARKLMTQGSLKPYFSIEEIGAYMDMIRPKMEAARNIENIMRMSQSNLIPNDGISAPATRAVAGTIFTHASNVVMNALVTIVARTSRFGPKTAERMQQLVQNPTWKTFNAVNKSITDPVERRMFNQMVMEAIDTTVANVPTVLKEETQEAMIRGE